MSILSYIKLNILCNSPLDQFGAESLGTDIFDTFDIFFFNMLDLLDISDIISISFIQGLVSSIYSTFFYDDDDCGDSDWDENDINNSGNQSSILFSNLTGLIPGMETTTAEATITFFYSVSTIITLILIGFTLHNVRYLSILYPTGTPVLMAPFIILIEFISYIARAVSLGMRLFANIFAGHSLVKILISFAWLFLTSSFSLLSVPVFILLAVIFFIEMGIAYLQAYVFGALSSIYFEDVIALGH